MAKKSKTWWKIIPYKPSINVSLDIFSMLPSIIVNMVNAKKLIVNLPTTFTFSPIVGQNYFSESIPRVSYRKQMLLLLLRSPILSNLLHILTVAFQTPRGKAILPSFIQLKLLDCFSKPAFTTYFESMPTHTIIIEKEWYNVNRKEKILSKLSGIDLILSPVACHNRD